MPDITDLTNLDESLAVGAALVSRLQALTYHSGQADKVKAVFAAWATPEDVREYPSIAVVVREADYDAQNLSPAVLDETYDAVTKTVLVQDAEWVSDVEVHIVCTDPVQRSRVVKAVRERLMGETLWDGKAETYGVDLSVPGYFGGVYPAKVSLRRVRFEDTDSLATQRERRAVLYATVRLPVLRRVSVAELQPSAEFMVEGGA